MTNTPAPRALASLLHPKWMGHVRADPRGFASVIAPDHRDQAGSSSFDGLYGSVYSAVMQRPRLLELASAGLWGRRTFLSSVGMMLDRAIAGCDSSSVLLDVPCGAGTLLPLLARREYDGLVVEADLSPTMLARAVENGITRAGHLNSLFLQCNALELPLQDGVIDVVVGINGLHCMPHHVRYLGELRRVLRPGGSAWLTTMIADDSRRHAAVARAAQRAGVVPGPLPRREEIAGLVREAGFAGVEDLGGDGVIGLRLISPQR